ncbi:MAG: trigger factor [Firmicutes bacterium]|nr:trigger factor [Bacillota bacterium]MCL2255757.1 trigger factor [Bacillota bacterium]
MNYTLEKKKGEAHFKFTLTHAEWENAVNNAYEKEKKKYSIPGFRKGKLPRKVIENYYGVGVFFDEAINICISESYAKALNENDQIIPVDEPKVDVETLPANEKEELKFSVKVVTRPELKLGQYKGLTIKGSSYTVSEKDMEKEITTLRERAARKVAVTDRKVQDGDILNIDYSGKVNGKIFDGGTAEKQTLAIGSNTFIPGFEDGLVGAEIGQTLDIKVKFPDEYHSEELKGKDAVFTVTVNGIEVKELPEFNDEFIKDVAPFETVEEFKKDLKAKLEENFRRRGETETETKLIDAIVNATTVDIPEVMIEDEAQGMLDEFAGRLKYMYGGMKLEDYLNAMQTSAEDFKKERRPEAEKAVKTRLVLQDIVKAEKLQAELKDMEELVADEAAKARQSAEDYLKRMPRDRFMQLNSEVLVKKLFGFLKKENTIEYKKSAVKEASTEKKAEKKEPAKTAPKTSAKPKAKKED